MRPTTGTDPGLIDADVADDVGHVHAAVSIGASARRRNSGGDGEIVDRSAVEHGRIIDLWCRHPVAELRGVLDVVHAGNGVVTAIRYDELLPGYHARASA